MKKLLYLLSLLLLLVGCNVENEHKKISYSKINMDTPDKEVKEFLGESTDENGIYLYQDSGKRLYVFLNSKIVEQGNEASYFTSFDVKSEEDTLIIYFEQDLTDVYVNNELNNQVLYEVQLNNEYEYIKLFEDNEEKQFSIISGRNI
ncbi:hypothetical protein [Aquibacillus rhizosphaerae]|uniref:Lipoprotein n=1 Tax=Aquibacillus rhizosphaerae TaxID=3051431 RepID=A0ABT7LCL9_9BACI|nr:hypothetical protein [Aquibacillus sp. LR5S19]MDL4842301.1 hypothetical protein [Aquibacillus sp. LR5S19]